MISSMMHFILTEIVCRYPCKKLETWKYKCLLYIIFDLRTLKFNRATQEVAGQKLTGCEVAQLICA